MSDTTTKALLERRGAVKIFLTAETSPPLLRRNGLRTMGLTVLNINAAGA